MEKNENHPIPLPRRRLTRRGFIRGMGIAAGVVTLAPVIAACGSSNNTTKTSNANTSNSASTSGTTAPAGSATAASAAPSGAVTPIGGAAGAPSAADLASADKQTLTLVNVEPNFLDPQRASFGSDIAVIKQIYRGLLYIDKNDPNKVIAAAAKDVPSASNGGISSDGKTYTLHLNSGLKWQDGSALTAKDFEYSIKRLFDPNLAGDYSSFYFNIVGSEDYYNALGTKAAPKKPTTDQLTQLQNGVGVQATDDSTLVIKLINPQPSFNTLLTLWPVFPVQKAQIDKYADKAFAEASNIVGNGPFKLSEWVHKDHLTLVPNTNWWGQDKPYLQKLVMKDIEDDTVAFTAYKNGELDMTGVPIADVDVVKSDPTLSKENYRADQQTTYGLEFNVSKAPFLRRRQRPPRHERSDRPYLVHQLGAEGRWQAGLLLAAARRARLRPRAGDGL
jgi:ABC-type oligopeptide transport system substrate-binding subunit